MDVIERVLSPCSLFWVSAAQGVHTTLQDVQSWNIIVFLFWVPFSSFPSGCCLLLISCVLARDIGEIVSVGVHTSRQQNESTRTFGAQTLCVSGKVAPPPPRIFQGVLHDHSSICRKEGGGMQQGEYVPGLRRSFGAFCRSLVDSLIA